MSKILITSALPYVNNIPHIGNIVGSHLPADIFARFCRIEGNDVAFVGGSDAHGTPVEVAALKEHKTPKELADYYYTIHKELYNWFDISYDLFSKTNSDRHYQTTIEFFNLINQNGYIEEREMVMPYCEHDKMFLPDRYIEGNCPKCKEIARGDQCDCGYVLSSPQELINPYCVICKNKPVFKTTKHLFIRFDKLEKELDTWIESNKEDWNSLAYGIAKGWINKGLQPRAITRDLKWGVKVPLKGFEDKVFYVWFDAPIGYVTFTEQVSRFENAWLEKDTKIYHFLGKDNIPFHTIFWPGFLIGTKKYRLPNQVIGLSYLNFEGQKFSKSKNIGIFGDMPKKSSLNSDYWRFYLAFLIPETADTNWSWEDFDEKINKVLVGNLSNFVYRTLSLVKKNDYILPNPKESAKELELYKKRDKIITEYKILMNDVRLRDGLRKALELSDLGNMYLQESEPWKSENKTSLYVCANLCVDLAKMLSPFIPKFSAKVLSTLGINKYETLKAGAKINEPEIIFKRVDVKELRKELGL